MLRRIASTLRNQRVREESNEYLAVEVLEDRTLLSFIGHVSNDTLYVTQTAAEGNVVFDDHGPNGTLRVTDLSGTLTFESATNVSIVMRERPGFRFSTTVDMDSPFLGDFRISRNPAGIHFVGDSNTFGSLVIGMNESDQHINLAVNADLNVIGSMVIAGGLGNDLVKPNGRNVNIGGRLYMDRVNRFVNDGSFVVGESISWEFYDEAQKNFFRNDGVMDIGGNLTINGFNNANRDQMDRYHLINMSVGGDIFIDLGEYSGNEYQVLNLNGFVSGRNATFYGGTGFDRVNSNVDTQVDGNILIDFRGGTNIVNLMGSHSGERVTYRGGDGKDTVRYSMDGTPDVINLMLHEGNDWLEFSGNVTPNLFRTDFGGGLDTLALWSPDTFDFQANFLNWNGFNHFYHDGIVAELQEDRPAGDIRFSYDNGQLSLYSLGAVASMPMVDAVVTYMRNNSGGRVEVDLAESLTMETFGILMGHGQRTLKFTGSNNTLVGDLIVDGVLGDQSVYFDQNNALTVTGKMIVDLRTGDDRIMPIKNGITVGQDLTLRGANYVRNEALLEVGGNFLFSSATEFQQQSTLFESTAWLTVGGWFNYHGGQGIDQVKMNGEESFAGNVFVDLNFGVNGGAQQIADFSGSEIFGDLKVHGSSSQGGNVFVTDDFTSVGNNVLVEFIAPGPHTAVFLGTYGGSYGTYRGGQDADQVTFGAKSDNMTFFTRLGQGDDLFRLLSETQLTKLIVDFGPGSDQFDDQIGEPYPFDVRLKNYP